MFLLLYVLLFLILFKKQSIDYIKEVNSISSNGIMYNIVANKYLTKQARIKAIKTNDVKNTTKIM